MNLYNFAVLFLIGLTIYFGWWVWNDRPKQQPQSTQKGVYNWEDEEW